MVVIGLTGGLGTGKSTVAKMFGDLGAVVLDADRIAHEVMEPKKLAWRAIVKQFGQGVLNEDQTINRRWLADRVFRDPQARRQLEEIVHPRVLQHIKQRLHRLSRNRPAYRAKQGKRPSRGAGRRLQVVVLDVPLLIESGVPRLVDTVVVVTAPPEVQRRRLTARGMAEEEINARVAAQWEPARKTAVADYVVDNADGLEQTRRQVKQLWNQLAAASKRCG
jgi:dephospho-CoA kinase